jgi:hypothetical protein
MSIDQVNMELLCCESYDEGDLHPLEYLELLGIVEEVFPSLYPYADEKVFNNPF